LQYIDKYKNLSGNTLEDEEVFDLITKYNYDDDRIKEEVLRQKDIIKKRGEEYEWKAVGKTKTTKQKEESTKDKGGKKQKPFDSTQQGRRPYKNKDEYNKEYKDTYNDYHKEYKDYNEYDEFGQYTSPKRGTRGARGVRRGQRGARGGRRNFEDTHFEVVEKHLPNEAVETTNTNKQTEPESHTQNDHEQHHTNTTHTNTHTNTVVHEESPKHKQKDSPKKSENIDRKFNEFRNEPKQQTASHHTQSNKFNNEIQTVESFFQSLERESEVTKLIDDDKGMKKTCTYEDFVEQFVKSAQFCPKVSVFTIPASTSTKTVPQSKSLGQSTQSYTHPSTSTTGSSSTNKNFPQKTNFPQQQPYSEFMGGGYGGHNPMMYPWIPNPEVNPQLYQQYQQMMPMFYQMFHPMMYQQQMPESEYPDTTGVKGGQKNPPKNYSGMPMPQMGYMNPNFPTQENPNFYGGGSQKNEENQNQFPNYYYGGNK